MKLSENELKKIIVEELQNIVEIERGVNSLRDAAPMLLKTLKDVSKWCHQGHGLFPQNQCGLCKPVLQAISRATENKN